MKILGISSYYHDSSAALIIDGKIVSAVEQERFSRKKHDNSFPHDAINFCLKSSDLKISDIDYVSYYEKPLLKFERIIETFIRNYPRSLIPFVRTMPEWLGEKIKVEQTIRNLDFSGKLYFVPHHLSHAGSAFLTSGFGESAILTIDGVGDRPTTGLWIGKGNKIRNIGVINFPHSLGLFYSTFTTFLGFRVNNDEYKVMGLAAYGKPKYEKKIKKLININPDGSFSLNMKYFSYTYSDCMWSRKFEKLFGSSRKYGDEITDSDADLAASLQKVTEEVYFNCLNSLYKKTRLSNLCISGGVALNSLANGKIYDATPFKKIYNFGPAGDGGNSLGAALCVYNLLRKQPRISQIKTLNLGSSYSNESIRDSIEQKGITYKYFNNDNILIKEVARLLARGNIIGWYQGKMEFGPRALGNRSILADPKDRIMKDKVNVIKKREKYRPFAGSVLQEHIHKLFFVLEKNHYSPFMNFCFKVRKNKQELIQAIVHEDGTCRVQTVNKDNELYYHLIKEFYKLTGTPCILNTSFNLNMEPIVEHPIQAINDFLNTSMDYLIIDRYMLKK
jgi:carbamoyltransferase